MGMMDKVKQNKKWIIVGVFVLLVIGGFVGLW